MRRAIALARDYARRRVAFGARLSDKPLHLETLAGLQAEYEGALQLAFLAVELLGKLETGEAGEREQALLRLVTPIAKLTTAKQAVTVASEVLECFGGAGYVEDTGLPVLLRDAQVLPIWEGTTNVLSLDVLRALSRDRTAFEALVAEVATISQSVRHTSLVALGRQALSAIQRAGGWLIETMGRDPLEVEAGARRFALTLGRSLELALLVRQAQHGLDAHGDERGRAAAERFARERFDLVDEVPLDDARARARRSLRVGGRSKRWSAAAKAATILGRTSTFSRRARRGTARKAAMAYDFGVNLALVEELFLRYQENPAAVSERWRTYFDSLAREAPGANGKSADAAARQEAEAIAVPRSPRRARRARAPAVSSPCRRPPRS
ncbi:MAG: acyl-CoA dehydrogenase family protein [Sandaracinaceae bacterium]|nr:acyl-CoA dehydrogenase family protein [Sandaracinaceae bacterium]